MLCCRIGGSMPRMQILTTAEQDVFDSLPIFSDAEREKFFHVSESLDSLLATLRSPINRVCLLLTIGYFRATKRFFVHPFHQTDVAYVVKTLEYVPEQIDLSAYDEKATTRRHRKQTLDYLGYRPFNAQAQQEMAQETCTMIRSQMRPMAIFQQVVELLETRKTEIPSAFALTKLIMKESQRHKRRLIETIETHLSSVQRELLDALLDKQEQLWQTGAAGAALQAYVTQAILSVHQTCKDQGKY